MSKIIGIITEKVKNIVAKGEIAHFEQFLLFVMMFSKMAAADGQNASIGADRVKHH